jgi:hypothetical protein
MVNGDIAFIGIKQYQIIFQPKKLDLRILDLFLIIVKFAEYIKMKILY